ncbi:winged helix-turn-helix domain-containing protein [Serratia fonticola]|uniref:winged helix-turn-helix domain-containing protein n=1 Tax=Serratia fonticola TaxID=47917 RepID=UPI001C484FD8|nr:helix-turn-helix domain-containing protein [Serratia fonticola]QXN65197.1 helix-turn-helix domain-containing protein [Serratia fonticola]
MDNRLYGYLLDDDIIFNIATRRFIHHKDEDADCHMFFKTTSLSETQTRLFIFLMKNRSHEVINKNDIFVNVWDEFKMSSSSQRLWQTVNDLRKKMSSIGLPDNFIESVHGMGYRIGSSHVRELKIS